MPYTLIPTNTWLVFNTDEPRCPRCGSQAVVEDDGRCVHFHELSHRVPTQYKRLIRAHCPRPGCGWRLPMI